LAVQIDLNTAILENRSVIMGDKEESQILGIHACSSLLEISFFKSEISSLMAEAAFMQAIRMHQP
jgi:hypothetical protein